MISILSGKSQDSHFDQNCAAVVLSHIQALGFSIIADCESAVFVSWVGNMLPFQSSVSVRAHSGCVSLNFSWGVNCVSGQFYSYMMASMITVVLLKLVKMQMFQPCMSIPLEETWLTTPCSPIRRVSFHKVVSTDASLTAWRLFAMIMGVWIIQTAQC